MIYVRFKFPDHWGDWVPESEKSLDEARTACIRFFDNLPNWDGITLYEFKEE
ncbi:TPA_asm: hypothetical protein vir530_00021 [dsDNA virus vir530]|jgi:hypothetical protein|nr:TPA_asm: hypothetical protein vir530_00021 [dsDNA virus vir530]